MIDERIIQSQEFMKDDDFISFEEFKYFLFKIKKNELTLQLKLGASEEKVAELVQKLQEYDPNNQILTIDEARELVKRSEILLSLDEK